MSLFACLFVFCPFPLSASNQSRSKLKVFYLKTCTQHHAAFRHTLFRQSSRNLQSMSLGDLQNLVWSLHLSYFGTVLHRFCVFCNIKKAFEVSVCCESLAWGRYWNRKKTNKSHGLFWSSCPGCNCSSCNGILAQNMLLPTVVWLKYYIFRDWKGSASCAYMRFRMS